MKKLHYKREHGLTIYTFFSLSCLMFLFTACSTRMVLSSNPEKASLTIAKSNISGITPIATSIRRTTFGNYPFKIEKEGFEPMYGSLPLNVSGTAITMDVLFLGPAALWNTRRAFPFYEFDLEKRVIKYKIRRDHGWMEYRVKEVEETTARSFFGVSPQETNRATSPNTSPTSTISSGEVVKPTVKEETALDILKKRYARGEITKEQFDTMKEDLK